MKKRNRNRSQMFKSLTYAQEVLGLIEGEMLACKYAHRKFKIDDTCANAIVYHVTNILKRANVDFSNLPAWECAVVKHSKRGK